MITSQPDLHPTQSLARAQQTVHQLQDSDTQYETVHRLVQRVTVYNNRLVIDINTENTFKAEPIEIPIRIKRVGLALSLLVGGETTQPRIDAKLVALIRKAHRWWGYLESGRCASVGMIAQQEKVTSSYVTRVVYLALMAPEIVQRIVQGQQPNHLTADSLIRLGAPPVAWSEQWAWLGMQPR